MSFDPAEDPYRPSASTAQSYYPHTDDPRPEPSVGIGYVLVLVLNVFSLLGGVLIFLGGFNPDGFVGIGEIVVGGPFLSVQFFVGGVPAIIYAGKNARIMDKAEVAVCILLPVLAMALTAAGIAMAIVLPHHGAS